MPVIVRDGIETCGENVLVTAATSGLAVRRQLLSGSEMVRAGRIHTALTGNRTQHFLCASFAWRFDTIGKGAIGIGAGTLRDALETNISTNGLARRWKKDKASCLLVALVFFAVNRRRRMYV